MQTGNQENVVSLFSRKNAKVEDAKKEDTVEENLSFEEVMRRNLENTERMKRERAKANKGVIRSYRLLKK